MSTATIIPFPDMVRTDDSALPNRIRLLRKARNLTLADVAPLAGMTSGHLQKLEVGERELTLPVMERVAAALAVNVADLLPSALGGLTEKERHIIDTYREVPSYMRGAIEGVAESQQQWRGLPEVAGFPDGKPQDRARSA